MGSRRFFLKLLAFSVLIAPFIPIGRYLQRREKVDQIKQRVANINELKSLGEINFVFPRTGDPEQDMDPFRQYALILTPTGEVRALSRVCVHLWCLWKYDPNLAECICPCHGSVYNPDTGVATKGPAYYQPYPTNALPMLKVELNEDGDIYVSQLDGIVGYGREWKKDLANIQSMLRKAPDKEIRAYTPFWKSITITETEKLIRRYNIKVLKIYGYVKRGKETEWLVAGSLDEAKEKMEWVYSIEIFAKPGEILKVAEDDRVIIPMIRGNVKP